jgi:predicted deacylase
MTPPATLHLQSIQYQGLCSGPRVIVTGAVHGNEPCGTEAIGRVMREIDAGVLRIAAGSVTFVPVTNPLAYARAQRIGERNLNRKLFPSARPRDFEDRVANWLCPLLARHDVLLDLHSFNAGRRPFCMVGPCDNDGTLEPFAHAAQERALALRLGVQRFVEGWLAAYAKGVRRRIDPRDASRLASELGYGVGTTEFMRRSGGYALTLECGQHVDPAAIEVAYRAIKNTLAFLGVIDAPRPAPVPAQEIEALTMADVHDKVGAADAFSRAWASFDPVRKGGLIGTRADGAPVLAGCDGAILFPDAAAEAGQEWYYMATINPQS